VNLIEHLPRPLNCTRHPMNHDLSLTAWPSRLAAASLLAMLHAVAFAHAGEGEGSETSQWGLGLMVMSGTKPYRGFDNEVKAIPVVMFENRWVRVIGPGLELKLGQTGPVAFGAVANYAGDGYDASDSPFLSGMGKRKSSFWLGGRMRLKTDVASLSTEWTADASGNSKGQKFKLGVERRFAVGDLGITPKFAATWLDKKYVQYYFGVEPGEAASGRPAYQARSATNTELGLRLDYRLAPQHTLLADLGVTSLASTIKNSPIVNRNNVAEVRIGYLYRF
jgi:MipA family protein